MDIQPDFSGYYKRLGNIELLDILENSGTLQAAALEAAKKELSNRQLSEEEVGNARKVLIEKQLLIEEEEQRKKAFQDKMDYTGNSIIASINPDQEGIGNNERSIRIIVIALGVLFLYGVIRDFTMIQFFMKHMADSPMETISIILPLVILPLALFLFWKRSPSGWRLLTIWLTFFIVNNAGLLLSSSVSGPLDYSYQTPSIPGIVTYLLLYFVVHYIRFAKTICG